MNSARMNYRSYPTDYIQSLKQSRGIKGRKKARAFMEYFDDMEHGEHNSETFYAKSWEVSRSTAHEWIKEFHYEIELFFNHWTLKNRTHYTHAQKSTEQQPSKTSTHEAPNIGVCENTAEQQPREVFNINNNNNKGVSFFDAAFEDMYRICRMFHKKTGKKDEVYEEYQNHLHVKHMDMRLAYISYVNDTNAAEQGKHFGLANFMRNNIYLSYLRPLLHINKGDETIEGEYDMQNEVVITPQQVCHKLTKARFAQMLSCGQVKIIGTRMAP